MKKRILCFLAFLVLQLSHTQTVAWAKSLGNPYHDFINQIQKTPDGFLATPNGTIVKLSEDGDTLWRFNYFDNFDITHNIVSATMDENGAFYAIINMWENTVINNIDFHKGESLIKISPEGDILWTRKLHNCDSSKVYYQNRHIYVIGRFRGSMHINEDVFYESKELPGGYPGFDLFLAKFSTIGVLQDSKTMGDTLDEIFIDATLDDQENIYLTAHSGKYHSEQAYTQLVKFNADLELLWKNVFSEQSSGSRVFPSNIYYSNKRRVYLWANNNAEVTGNGFTIPFEGNRWNSSLIEFNPQTGDYIRHKTFALGTYQNVSDPFDTSSVPYPVHAFMADFNDQMIIFTAMVNPYTFDNVEYIPQGKGQNLILLSVDQSDLTTNFLTAFERPPYYGNRNFVDEAREIFIDDTKLYLSANFQSDTLDILGNMVANRDPSSGYGDILLARLDLSDLLNAEDLADTDQDGIVDYKDNCPETPAGAAVDAYGCSILQLDSDQDGVYNEFDACPDTPPGVEVKSNGCIPLKLPADNFEIRVTDEVCPEANNGRLLLNCIDTSYTYWVALNGGTLAEAEDGSYQWEDLRPGNYEVCIYVEDFPEVEQCFELSVKESTPIAVSSRVSASWVTLNMTGAASYTITHNEKTFTTQSATIELPLASGTNTIEVRSDNACQGVYKEEIHTDSHSLFPNPFQQELTLTTETSNSETTADLYHISGRKLRSYQLQPGERTITFDTADLSPGIYVVQVINSNRTDTYKVIKK